MLAFYDRSDFADVVKNGTMDTAKYYAMALLFIRKIVKLQ